MTMILRRLYRLPFLSLLMLCLLASPASSFGYVWCLDADGHAALETALAGDCGMDSPAHPAGGHPVSGLATDDCGPCLDISSSPHWGASRGRDSDIHFDSLISLAPADLPARLLLPDRELTNRLLANPAPRPPDPILHHRTVVLLI